MARFQFHRRPLSQLASRRKSRPAQSVCAAFDETAARGPGWFESSWELVRGLIVREGLPNNAGLDEWLGAYLCELTVPTAPRPVGRINA